MLIYLSVIEEADQNRFTKFHDRHEQQLKLLAIYCTGGDVHRAEDLLQETWLYVAEQFSRLQFEHTRAEFSYLRTVLQYRYKSMQKQYNKDRAHVDLHEDMDLLSAEAASLTEHELCEKESWQQIADILCKMPLTDRDLLLMAYDADHTTREIATLLGLSESAVKSRLYRARQRLKKEMRKAGLENEWTE
jgi:RNA polymerase sigma-70 factor (ECF subfamily)